jgi:hypothetical protein
LLKKKIKYLINVRACCDFSWESKMRKKMKKI